MNHEELLRNDCHPWCRNTARDEAVRAAEDGRQRRLPTLEEATQRAFTKTATIRETETPVEPVIPAADAQGGGVGGLRTEPVTERRPPEPGGGENVTPGLRTERVVLEIRYDPQVWNEPSTWAWNAVLKQRSRGVRVVEETIPPAPVSRPAVTRQTKAERVGGGWWFPKYDLPSPPPPPPPAPPRAHRASGVFDANGDEVPWEGVVSALKDERDAAIRERDALRVERITQSLTADRFASAVAKADRLRARVSELESQLESVACRAAKAETALREIFAQDYARASVNCAAWKMHDIAEKALKSAPAASGNGQGILDGSQAASGAANSPESPVSSEPDAWGVKRDGTVESVAHRRFRNSAEHSAEHLGGTVVPLYTFPPPARGWLTEEERGSILYAIEGLREAASCRNNGHAMTLESLLDRSTPPEVVRPAVNRAAAPTYVEIVEDRDAEWLAAIAAAGVPAKEVGRE